MAGAHINPRTHNKAAAPAAAALLKVYLNNINAGVQVDGAFGFLAVLLVLVGVEDVGTVGELGQVEVSPFEHLKVTAKTHHLCQPAITHKERRDYLCCTQNITATNFDVF